MELKYNRKIASLIFLLVMFVKCASSAGGNAHDYVLSLCQNSQNWLDQKQFVGTIKETVAAGFLNANALTRVITNRGLSQEVQEILTSNDYSRSLHECFGDDLLKKNMFTASLIARDVFARTIGIAFAGGIYYYGGGLLKAVATLYPAVNVALIASGIVHIDNFAVQILKNYIVTASPEEKAELKRFISENRNSMKNIDEMYRIAIQSELEKIETMLSESIYNLQKSPADLIIKRQKAIAALLALKNS